MKRSSSTKSRSGAATRKASTTGRRQPSRSSSSRGGSRAASGRGATRRPATRRSSARRPIPWPVYAALLLGFALWSFYPAARVEYAEQREKARLEAQLSEIRQRNDTLRAQVDRLKTPEGVEDLARRNLGYVAPGEHAYVVGDSEEPTKTPVAQRSSEETSSLGRRILDFVFAVR